MDGAVALGETVDLCVGRRPREEHRRYHTQETSQAGHTAMLSERPAHHQDRNSVPEALKCPQIKTLMPYARPRASSGRPPARAGGRLSPNPRDARSARREL